MTDREAVRKELYAMDLGGAAWQCPPGQAPGTGVEVAFFGPDGKNVAMRNGAEPDGPVLRFTPAEWEAFRLGALDGEFDL